MGVREVAEGQDARAQVATEEPPYAGGRAGRGPQS